MEDGKLLRTTRHSKEKDCTYENSGLFPEAPVQKGGSSSKQPIRISLGRHFLVY
jgi:hypothetical protein